jgi:hypothetical protein
MIGLLRQWLTVAPVRWRHESADDSRQPSASGSLIFSLLRRRKRRTQSTTFSCRYHTAVESAPPEQVRLLGQARTARSRIWRPCPHVSDGNPCSSRSSAPSSEPRSIRVAPLPTSLRQFAEYLASASVIAVGPHTMRAPTQMPSSTSITRWSRASPPAMRKPRTGSRANT